MVVTPTFVYRMHSKQLDFSFFRSLSELFGSVLSALVSFRSCIGSEQLNGIEVSIPPLLNGLRAPLTTSGRALN